jgi:pyruvate-ferredoxin/flavodoxin oxidoreductase
MTHVTLDGNEAAAQVAYQLSDVIAIYPITPSSAFALLSAAGAGP